KSLRRLFRSLPRLLPHYALLDVRPTEEGAREGPADERGDGEAGAVSVPGLEPTAAALDGPAGEVAAEPGLAAGVEVAPSAPAPPRTTARRPNPARPSCASRRARATRARPARRRCVSRRPARERRRAPRASPIPTWSSSRANPGAPASSRGAGR